MMKILKCLRLNELALIFERLNNQKYDTFNQLPYYNSMAQYLMVFFIKFQSAAMV